MIWQVQTSPIGMFFWIICEEVMCVLCYVDSHCTGDPDCRRSNHYAQREAEKMSGFALGLAFDSKSSQMVMVALLLINGWDLLCWHPLWQQ